MNYSYSEDKIYGDRTSHNNPTGHPIIDEGASSVNPAPSQQVSLEYFMQLPKGCWLRPSPPESQDILWSLEMPKQTVIVLENHGVDLGIEGRPFVGLKTSGSAIEGFAGMAWSSRTPSLSPYERRPKITESEFAQLTAQTIFGRSLKEFITQAVSGDEEIVTRMRESLAFPWTPDGVKNASESWTTVVFNRLEAAVQANLGPNMSEADPDAYWTLTWYEETGHAPPTLNNNSQGSRGVLLSI